MKFTLTAVLVALSFVAVSSAQGIQFVTPSAGSTLTAGNSFSVEIAHADYIQNQDFIAAALTLTPVNQTNGAKSFVGAGLLTAATAVQPPTGSIGANQFDLTLPISTPAGQYTLHAEAYTLTGVGLVDFPQNADVSIVIKPQP